MLDFPIAAFIEYVAQCCDASIVAQDKYPGTPGVTSASAAAGQGQKAAKNDLEAGEVDAEAVGEQSAMVAAVEAIREFTGNVSAELAIIGTQLKTLHEAVSFSEVRRKQDAERLCESLLTTGST